MGKSFYLGSCQHADFAQCPVQDAIQKQKGGPFRPRLRLSFIVVFSYSFPQRYHIRLFQPDLEDFRQPVSWPKTFSVFIFAVKTLHLDTRQFDPTKDEVFVQD